ncbi:PREDICTED: gastrula zinc finger protein XlCGF48.2-like [Nanorana parkeri]|uniref:gastrula zinc finger protein XlCGF48.2-like n=1 Tax=Nanorana parkeri TaxID=125878 RepID=UPI000854BE69|nr:PREDICTED: gastrula zinc finger protein XlCGF48.2-like [Nanorana parkeri]
MTYPQRMEKERSKITERILNLTLDIIYLLSGENYIAFKLTDGLLASNLMKTQSPVIEPPSHSLRQKNKKVKEVTSEIIELLTGEVPIRCQDVTEHQQIPREDQVDEAEDLSDNMNQEDPITSQDFKGEDLIIKAEPVDEEEIYVSGLEPCKEEEIPVAISKGGRYDRNKTRNRLISSSDGEIEEYGIAVDSPGMGERLNTMKLDPKAHVARHEKVHMDVKPYSCSVCGRCYAHKSHLTSHLRSHTDDKWHSCPDCGICFGHKVSLVRHQRIHTNEKTFSCTECGRSFTQKSHLVDHFRIHTGEKPYLCLQCGKRFTVKRGLVSHEKIHSGKKRFSCPECGKYFTRKSYLVNHRRVHQRELLV